MQIASTDMSMPIFCEKLEKYHFVICCIRPESGYDNNFKDKTEFIQKGLLTKLFLSPL